jgi:adenylosuccinate lyase
MSRERYSDKLIEHIWSDDNKLRLWCQIEAMWLECLPSNPANLKLRDVIDQMANNPKVWMPEWKEQEEKVRHDLEAFLRVIETRARKKKIPTRYLHFGLTSSDVIDTTTSSQIAESTIHVETKVKLLAHALRNRAQTERRTPRVSRTHGQPAELSTFGVFWARAASQMDINMAPFKGRIVKVSGPTGEHRMCDLGLKESREKFLQNWARSTSGYAATVDDSTQIIPRHHYLGLLSALEAVSFGVERIARDLRLYSFSGEFSEGFGKKQVGSSAMPHKKNPIGLEKVSGLGRLVRAEIQVLRSLAMELWLERDISNSSVERLAWPDVFGLLSHMLDTMTKVVKEGIVNLEFVQNQTKVGEIFAHEVLNRLLAAGQFRHRSEAHEYVQSLCQEARTSGFSIQVVAQRRGSSAEVSRVISSAFSPNTVESEVRNGKAGYPNRFPQ